MHVESVDSYEAEPELHQVWNLLCRQSACRIVSLTLRQFVLIFSRIAAPLQKVCIKQSPERGTSALKALSTWVYFQVMQTPTNLNPLQKPLHARKAANQTGTRTVPRLTRASTAYSITEQSNKLTSHSPSKLLASRRGLRVRHGGLSSSCKHGS